MLLVLLDGQRPEGASSGCPPSGAYINVQSERARERESERARERERERENVGVCDDADRAQSWSKRLRDRGGLHRRVVTSLQPT